MKDHHSENTKTQLSSRTTIHNKAKQIKTMLMSTMMLIEIIRMKMIRTRIW